MIIVFNLSSHRVEIVGLAMKTADIGSFLTAYNTIVELRASKEGFCHG